MLAGTTWVPAAVFILAMLGSALVGCTLGSPWGINYVLKNILHVDHSYEWR